VFSLLLAAWRCLSYSTSVFFVTQAGEAGEAGGGGIERDVIVRKILS
jgi:hypothetical protein